MSEAEIERLHEEIFELKQQNKELIEFIKFLYEEGHIDDRFNNKCKEFIKI